MMSALRRLFGGRSDAAADEAKQQERARQEQYEQVKRGLHEAAQRVHFLEMEAHLQSRGIFPRTKDNRDE